MRGIGCLLFVHRCVAAVCRYMDVEVAVVTAVRVGGLIEVDILDDSTIIHGRGM